ncbi:MAG: Rne/Rng family ribonuclease [Candidatus Kapaibacterium sp.]
MNRREEQRDRDGKRPSQDGRDQRREEPRQHKPDTKEATSDRERDPNTRDGGQEERGESSQKKSSSRRRRPKRRGPRDGEQRRSEENGGATQTAEEKTSTSVGEKSESDRPNREQPQISAGEGETRPDSQPQQKRSSSKRRRPKSRKASSESSAATQAEAGREEKPEARRETGEARRSEGGKEEQKNRQPRKEGERSGGRENDRREASSPLPEATATPVGEGGEKSKSESGSGEEKAAVATKSSRKKSSRRKATPKPKSEAKEQVEGTEKKESTEKPSPDSGTKEKEPDQPSQKEKKAAAPRTARKSRAKKGTKKSGAEEKSADSKAEAKKESGESKPAQENQEQKGESKPKDSGESSQTSAKASPRRRSAKRSSAKKKKSGGDSEGSGSPRTMDAQLPTFQTKRFGEITISLERGQEILTQVTRESYASKGVKVSTKISLPGRFLVLMPLDPGVGISRKVQDPKERRRLRGIARKMLPEGFGCIIRTVAQDKDSEMLEQELQMLLDRWKVIDEKMRKAKAPLLLYKDQSVANTVMRDLFTPDVSRVVIDNKALHQEICDYVSWAAPSLLSKIEHFSGKNPIFQQFGIEKELDKMMSSKVWLSAGGYIILEQTEAMMVIDVNSGRYAKEKEQELNALKINLESAREIARQIRLRDIGGLLVIDFIDLYDEKNRKKVYDELKKELSRDRAKSVVLPMTQFGIVQMTRQRVRQQLVQTMSEPCPTCKGKGIVQSKSTILRRIERWLGSFRSDTREFRLTLTANPHVIDFLTEGDAMSRLTKLMLKHFVRIKVVPDESLDMEDFRFFSIRRQEDITQEYMEK